MNQQTGTSIQRNVDEGRKQMTHPVPASRSARPFVDRDLKEVFAMRGVLLAAADANMVIC